MRFLNVFVQELFFDIAVMTLTTWGPLYTYLVLPIMKDVKVL